MRPKEQPVVDQPKPFTPGVTKGMVREHALKLYPRKLEHGKLTLDDWVMAEKDLVTTLETENLGVR